MSQITFERVQRTFSRGGESFLALDDVSFEVGEREFVSIVGPSGCGKTTLMRMAAGLEFPSAGSVRVGGKEVEEPGPDRAVVFQQFALFPWKTVTENIGFGLKCKGASREARARTVARYIELMGLAGYEQAYPHQLSGGMLQRVLIAMAISTDADLVVADEPTSALDVTVQAGILDLLLEIQEKRGVGVLLITHDLGVARLMSDRIHVMKDGVFVEGGPVTEVVDHPKHPYTQKLLAAIPELGSWNDPLIARRAQAPKEPVNG